MGMGLHEPEIDETLNLSGDSKAEPQELLSGFESLELSAIEEYRTPVSSEANVPSVPGTPQKPTSRSRRRLNWSPLSALPALHFSTVSTATNSDAGSDGSPSPKSNISSSSLESDTVSTKSRVQAEQDNGSVAMAVLVLLTFVEKQIEKLRQEERGPFFFLFYSLPATLDKIAVFRDTLENILDDNVPLKTLADINNLTSRLANDSMAVRNRNFLSFGASESKRGLSLLSVKDHQAVLRKILETELQKISMLSPNGTDRIVKIGYVDSLFYSQEKTQEKLTAVELALYDLESSDWSIDTLDVFLKKLLADNALCQHRSCGFFGKHMSDSTTKQKLAALSQTVSQGAELSQQLFADAERRFGV